MHVSEKVVGQAALLILILVVRVTLRAYAYSIRNQQAVRIPVKINQKTDFVNCHLENSEDATPMNNVSQKQVNT